MVAILAESPPNRSTKIYVGVDAATKHDAAAVVAVTRDEYGVRLVRHRIWHPQPNDVLDLGATIEDYVRRLDREYTVAGVFYDPFQMIRSEATLMDVGVPMVELPQTSDIQG